jgi:hypothetical protein
MVIVIGLSFPADSLRAVLVQIISADIRRMRQSCSSPHLYSESSYDHYLCLKPPLLLWFAVLYLSRAVTLPAAMGIGTFAGVNADAIALFRGLWSMQTLLPSLIAICFLYALCRRVPGASKPVRWIWARGRILLAASAGMDLALSLISMIRHGEIDDQALMSLLAAAADAYFLLYILVARRVRDTFSEFPAPLEPAGK